MFKKTILILAILASLGITAVYGQTNETAACGCDMTIVENLDKPQTICDCGPMTAFKNESAGAYKAVVEVLGHPQLDPVTRCDAGNLRGDAVDIALLVLPESGYPAIPGCHDESWDQILAEIKDDPWALGAAAFYTPERASNYIFSEEIGIYDTIVAYANQSSGIIINNTDDLWNLTGGSTTGDRYGPLDPLLEGIKRFTLIENCLTALDNGTIDYYIGSERAIDEVLASSPLRNQFNKSPVLAEIPFRFIISKNSLIDMNAINETLRG